MSADELRRRPAGRALRAVFSLLLIAMAGGAAYKGLQFARLGVIEWGMERQAPARTPEASAAGSDLPGRAQDLRDTLAQWHDSWGLRDKTRLLAFSIGQNRLDPASPNGLEELVAVLQVDPVRSASWMDLAEMTWPTLALRPTSMAAWDMSRLTGPYEYAEMVHRVRFMARRWIFAGSEARRKFTYDVVLMSQFPEFFWPFWRSLLRSLPAPQRRAIRDEGDIVFRSLIP
ncbi:hypothetical protein KHC23_06805 [Ancylobacter dichloromethanicus]|uniref:Uncharacterized protein n=2 Tax=Ancylobacter dichloromethanicus TaxID=518825 RepID=A0A9W6N255_9HYPH|nr:hypothetical protein [Ancylobacter dichloromethanicus]MBS7553356.1 hypothetical protein [Ancylobacter dichloromethanicus]GLK74727.1 hypothetical protein GCM10017643_48460 [Ancylobacter dichloromethanicus]